MDNLVPLLNKADREGFKMEPTSITIFGGWFPKGKGTGTEKWIAMLVMRNLDPQKEYRIAAAGDNDAKDVDIRVLDPTGKVVAQDDKALRDAEVSFRPTRVQDYTIELRLYNSTDNCICVGSILSRK